MFVTQTDNHNSKLMLVRFHPETSESSAAICFQANRDKPST